MSRWTWIWPHCPHSLRSLTIWIGRIWCCHCPSLVLLIMPWVGRIWCCHYPSLVTPWVGRIQCHHCLSLVLFIMSWVWMIYPHHPLSFVLSLLQLLRQYFSLNRLSTFSSVHLILSQHVIILSQSTLISLSIFSRDPRSPLCLHCLYLISVLCMAMFFFSSLPFWCLMHHTCHASILCTASLISVTHSPGLRVIPYALSIGRFDTNMYTHYE